MRRREVNVTSGTYLWRYLYITLLSCQKVCDLTCHDLLTAKDLLVCLYETGHLIKFRGPAPFSACHIGVHLFLCHVCLFLSCLFLCYVRVFLSGIFAQDATWWMGGVLFIRVRASNICISWMSCEGAGRGRSPWDQGSLCHHCGVTVTGDLVELKSPKGNGGFKEPKLLCSR